ncbi:hypothetical protein SAY86_019572 [Trapa natans]|nr:hypothetical protein SAY86_019572 [Trapa natans]
MAAESEESSRRTRSAKPERKDTGSNKRKLENHKKKKKQAKLPSTPSPLPDSTTISTPPEKLQRLEDHGFSTPNSPKYRIPEMGTCPPAPKRQRAGYCHQSRPLSRRRIVFLTPMDLGVLFFLADNTISR